MRLRARLAASVAVLSVWITFPLGQSMPAPFDCPPGHTEGHGARVALAIKRIHGQEHAGGFHASHVAFLMAARAACNAFACFSSAPTMRPAPGALDGATPRSAMSASSSSGAAAIRRALALSTGFPFIVPTVQILRGPASGVPTERTAGWSAVGCNVHGPGVCFAFIAPPLPALLRLAGLAPQEQRFRGR